MKIFDTHTHYDDTRYNDNRTDLIPYLLDKYLLGFISVGCNLERSQKAITLAETYKNVYAAVGVHPGDVSNLSDDFMDTLFKMISNSKVKAIGEIGLDYHYLPPKDMSIPKYHSLQRLVFKQQMQLALEHSLPVIIHSREAMQDTIKVISSYNMPELSMVMHCYSGSAESAHELIKKGLLLSFTGTVTFQNARKIIDSVKVTPLSRLMIETDCPYLSPHPHRGKTNSGEYIHYIAEKIAEIKDVSVGEVINASNENAKKFFKIEF